MRRTPYVAVVGPGEASSRELAAAEEIGAALAGAGAVVVTGGLGGVMAAACRGARARKGHTLGILPGEDRATANEWVEIAVATGMGELRNGLVVRAADALIAVGGGHGTLSEVALALKLGRPVVGLGTWEVHGVEHVSTPEEAVDRIAALLGL
ncbi:MAG: hypothetical protein QOD55_1070 [Solirubrobacteraceae bacterium]|nr:hypothetical protein [Solirubrobacteraceae bacterium]